jgi:hypothetical protein
MKSATDLGRREFFVFIGLLLLSIVFSAKPGADAPSYFYWEQYFITFDSLALADYPKSLRGLPLVQWQYGAGLLAAMLRLTFHYPNSIRMTAALIGVSNLFLLVCVARNYLKEWSLLGLATATLLLFTPAGYYLNSFSSEAWTIFLTLCGLYCIEWNRRQCYSPFFCSFVLGVACYFLLLVKSINLICCAALILIFLWDCYWTAEKTSGNFRGLIKIIVGLVLIPALALGYLATFNYVINGSILASPYLFQGSDYSAISFGRMKLWEILFSSWHGLFFYHPLLIVPIYWFLQSKKESAISFIVLGAIIAQVVIQSAWYVWWMGLGTFGARAFCGISILIFYAMMRCHHDRLVGILISNLNLIILAAFGTFEAYLIRIGESNFVDYSSFLYSFTWPIRSFSWCLVSFVVGRLLAWDLSKCLLVYILGLFPVTLLPNTSQLNWDIYPHLLFGVVIIVATVVCANHAKFRTASLQRFTNFNSIKSQTFTKHFVLVGATGALLFSIVLQHTMLWKFSKAAVPNFPGGKSFDCKALVETLREYDMIVGYDEDKAAMFAFSTKADCFAGEIDSNNAPLPRPR